MNEQEGRTMSRQQQTHNNPFTAKSAGVSHVCDSAFHTGSMDAVGISIKYAVWKQEFVGIWIHRWKFDRVVRESCLKQIVAFARKLSRTESESRFTGMYRSVPAAPGHYYSFSHTLKLAHTFAHP
jgi:hypothetical protein